MFKFKNSVYNNVTTRNGWKAFNRNEIKQLDDDDLKLIFKDPYLLTHAEQDLERIALLTHQIEVIEQKIQASVEHDSVFDRLLKIPGIGITLAATIKYESGEISRFSSLKKFSSYCRV
ncbi:MAG: transposase, partial [Planctomycetes bacterium]|nr:transposase [Planctomycetota bacterium]